MTEPKPSAPIVISVQSHAMHTATTASTTAATSATTTASSSGLDQSFNNLLQALGVSGNNASLNDFLQALASKMQGPGAAPVKPVTAA